MLNRPLMMITLVDVFCHGSDYIPVVVSDLLNFHEKNSAYTNIKNSPILAKIDQNRTKIELFCLEIRINRITAIAPP